MEQPVVEKRTANGRRFSDSAASGEKRYVSCVIFFQGPYENSVTVYRSP